MNATRGACCLVAGARRRRSPSSAQNLFNYEGADRMDKIVAAAKKEGTLTLYTTIAEKDLPAILKPFEQKYGVKVNVWRAGTDKVLQRTVTEANAKRYDVDAVHFGAPEMEALSREKILAPVVARAQGPAAGLGARAQGMGRDHPLGLGAGLQHRPREEAGPAEDLQGPPRSEVEGQARHRVEERRLVRDRRAPDGRRGAGPQVLPRPGRGQRHLAAPRPHAPQQHGGLGRGAARAHRLQLHARAGEEEGRAHRLVRDRARRRARQRGRRREERAASRTRRSSSTSTCSVPTARTRW